MLEGEIYQFLEQYNFSVPQYKVFSLNEEPSIDFYPVVLKIHSKKIVHKSDFGAVKLNITNLEDLKKAKLEILKNIKFRGVSLEKEEDKFIATNMISGGIEFYIGLVKDSIFGTTVLFGRGGVLLEIDKDICYIDTNCNDDEILRSVKTLKVSKIFDGFRSFKKGYEEVIKFIRNFIDFVQENPNIEEMDLNPVVYHNHKFKVLDARIKYDDKKAKTMLFRQNRPSFFNSKNIAIIGASAEQKKVGYAISKNSMGFQNGNVYFVNSKGGEILNKKVYKSIQEIEGNIDTAVITVPSKFIINLIKELVSKNIKNVIIISAGFKEVGDYESEEAIYKLSLEHNFNVIGPNCVGYYEGASNLNLTFALSPVKKGGLALIAQSGAVITALMDKAYDSNIGFSHIISLGNMVDLRFSEVIQMLNQDKNCKYISIYAEGILDGKAFLESIRNSKKPIYVYKSGKSEISQKAAFSHTGNLSGNFEMFKNLLENAGGKIEDNLESLVFDTMSKIKNIAVITNAGGPGSIIADYIYDRGRKLYELTEKDLKELDEVLPSNWSRNNPIDVIGDALSDRYEAALNVVDKIEEIDLIYVLITPQFMTDALSIVQMFKKNSYSKMIFPVLLGSNSYKECFRFLKENQIPYFTTLQTATGML